LHHNCFPGCAISKCPFLIRSVIYTSKSHSKTAITLIARRENDPSTTFTNHSLHLLFVMKLVYSLHIGPNKNREGSFCGYRNSEELLDSLLLSATISSKHFTGTELYCDSEVVSLMNEDGRPFPFNKVHVVFDNITQLIMPHNWAYTKLIVYAMQDEPFVHLDADAFLHDPLPEDILQKKFLFQQQEDITQYTFYTPLYNEAQRLNLLPPAINYLPAFAYNCGIFGALQYNCLPLVKKHFEAATAYIAKQQKVFNQIDTSLCHPILYEQLFISNILETAGLQYDKDIDAILNPDRSEKHNLRFTHLLVDSKRQQVNVDKIKSQLKWRGLIKDNSAAETIQTI
jgi:hypothetical protein